MVIKDKKAHKEVMRLLPESYGRCHNRPPDENVYDAFLIWGALAE